MTLPKKKGIPFMKKRYFTLVELLVVVGIVVILAGLVLPAVIGGAQQGRITQAKADMKSIQMALAQMDQTYGRILRISSNTTPPAVIYATGKDDTDTGTFHATRIASDGNLTGSDTSTVFAVYGPSNINAYNSLIAELTATGKKGNGTIPYQHNTRKIKFLDPNSSFDPASDFNSSANAPLLWRDPWGNAYTIMINVDGKERIQRPDNTSMYISGKTAIYSYGPNGEENNGKNAVEGGDKLDDDIATWHK
jgi:type II secretory pathway pseudopilin PulG